jgi:hypothetical protein
MWVMLMQKRKNNGKEFRGKGLRSILSILIAEAASVRKAQLAVAAVVGARSSTGGVPSTT